MYFWEVHEECGCLSVVCTELFLLMMLLFIRLNSHNFTVIMCQVMEVLMALQGSQMETDDPTISYMLQVYFSSHGLICKTNDISNVIIICKTNDVSNVIILVL